MTGETTWYLVKHCDAGLRVGAQAHLTKAVVPRTRRVAQFRVRLASKSIVADLSARRHFDIITEKRNLAASEANGKTLGCEVRAKLLSGCEVCSKLIRAFEVHGY